MAEAAVQQVVRIRQEKSLPYAVIARNLGVPESTLRRWRRRIACFGRVLTIPGPKKTLPVDMAVLLRDMAALRPGRWRTRGAPELWKSHQERISRRDFYSLLTRFSARMLALEKEGYYRYRWLKVGAVWAMDDMDFGHDGYGYLLRVHNVMDVGSRHMFEPLNSGTLPAEKVADNLERLFREHGASTFIKSDNATNLLRSAPVAKVLSRWCVIPILSPPRYPQYNGVMERGQSDTRRAVTDLLPENAACHTRHFRAYAVAGTYRRNHIRRAVLDGQHACQVFSARNGEAKTTIRERRAIYDWISNKQESILSSVAERDDWTKNAAWRSAAEEWMLQNQVIEIIPEKEKMSTDLSEMSAHN